MKLSRRTLLAASAALLAAPSIVRAQTGKEFTVLLDWFVNPNHGPIMAAQELGYFREAGLDARIVPPTDPNDPPRLVAAGRGDVAVSYQHSLVLQAVQDIPLMRIGALIDTPLSTITALADGPIRTLADFKGKRIGYSISGIQNALVKAMLASANVSIDDVQMINVNFSLSPALLAGRVEGVIGALRNFELHQLDLEGRPGRAFFLEEHGIPLHDGLIFVANRDRAKAKDPALRGFLDAVERGAQYCVNNPDEAWKLFLKGRTQLDNELNRRAWKSTLPRWAHSPAALDRARYKRFAEFLAASKLIAKEPDLDSFVMAL